MILEASMCSWISLADAHDHICLLEDMGVTWETPLPFTVQRFLRILHRAQILRKKALWMCKEILVWQGKLCSDF